MSSSQGSVFAQIAKLTAEDAATEDLFGLVVAIADDGRGSSSGSAYLFARNQGDADARGQVAKLIVNDSSAEDRAGFSVALSGDRALVGVYGDDDQRGAAYLFAGDVLPTLIFRNDFDN